MRNTADKIPRKRFKNSCVGVKVGLVGYLDFLLLSGIHGYNVMWMMFKQYSDIKNFRKKGGMSVE